LIVNWFVADLLGDDRLSELADHRQLVAEIPVESREVSR
jgi:hypothetical protein